MKWVTRPQWGASAQSPAQGAMPSNPRGVAIHWIGPGLWASRDPLQVMRQIRSWHVGNGHADIDYSLGVSADGRILEGRSTRARPRVRPASNGSRATNESHYSIVLLTGQGDPAPSAAMIRAAGQATAWLRQAGGAGPQVVGHRDLHATDCPGNTIQSMLGQIAAAANNQIGDTMTPEQETRIIKRLDKLVWKTDQLRQTDIPPVQNNTSRVVRPVDNTYWLVMNSIIPALQSLSEQVAALQREQGLEAQSFAFPEIPDEGFAE